LIEKTKKRRKLSLEILSVFAVCFALSVVLFSFLFFFTTAAVEEYLFYNGIHLDDVRFYGMENTVFGIAIVVSAVFFVIMFFALFGEKLAYIRTITNGVSALQRGEFGRKIEIEGNNELTRLAETVNYLSETEQKIKEKERRLNEEKEELIRTLSHDIRTPLTSVISYTELMKSKESISPEEQREYFELVAKKTALIKELTDILLDGGRRETGGRQVSVWHERGAGGRRPAAGQGGLHCRRARVYGDLIRRAELPHGKAGPDRDADRDAAHRADTEGGGRAVRRAVHRRLPAVRP